MAKKILLADDSITIQKVVELTFSDGDYEVIAVNNGAKAIQKLSELRPDIILSDIIMPEKNGYEVCEFVKSRPDFRNIPVVLLTGTFEPFDPDRADKAGCDAVVTKPFESQSLIHKVEELIQQSHAAAPAAAATQAEAEPASPWAEEKPAFSAPAETPFSKPPAFTAAPSFTPAPEPAEFKSHDADLFAAAPAEQPSSAADMPFETAPAESFSGETRAFPRMNFGDLQRAAEPQAPPAPPAPASAPVASEPLPWDEQPVTGAETRAFQSMSFNDLQRAAEPPTAPPPPAPAEPSPWDEQPAFGGETRGFPKMSFDDLQRAAEPAAPPAPAPAAPAEPSPWDEQPPAAESHAFTSTGFDEVNPPAAPAAEPSPWDEQPAFSGETRAFPKMSFDDLQQAAPAAPPAEAPRADSSLWDEAAPTAPSWSQPEAPAEEAAAPEPAPTPFAEPEPPEEESFFGDAAAAPDLPADAEFGSAAPTSAASPAIAGADLTDEQVERIARRVVQLLSSDVVKNIAWEVIPDMAEMVVKERIRQLETES